MTVSRRLAALQLSQRVQEEINDAALTGGSSSSSSSSSSTYNTGFMAKVDAQTGEALETPAEIAERNSY